jgi:hypothetical protein
MKIGQALFYEPFDSFCLHIAENIFIEEAKKGESEALYLLGNLYSQKHEDFTIYI